MKTKRSQTVDTPRSVGTPGSRPASPSSSGGRGRTRVAARNAAAYAGLAGSLALLVPSSASALSLSDVTATLDSAFSSPSIAFFIGLAWGAAASAAVCTAVTLASWKLEDRAAEKASEVVDEPEVSHADMRRMDAPQEGQPQEGAPAPAPAQAARSAGRHFAAGATPEPEAAPRRPDEPEAPAPQASASHAALDYEDIAENYVRRLTFSEKMARRAKGVAANLMERLDFDKMDGIPVITRADGTVGDVGTSWWEASVGSDAISPNSGFAPEENLAIPSDFGRPSGADFLGSAGAYADQAGWDARRGWGGEERMDALSDEEWERIVRGYEQRDAAARAFEAGATAPNARGPRGSLGDTTARMRFSDAVGAGDTLDEPDNLEPETGFIPFRPVAGHPEITDTESYLNHILEEELARAGAKNHLHMIQGGTGGTGRMVVAGRTEAARAGAGTPRPAYAADTGRGYVGKHFATPQAFEA